MPGCRVWPFGAAPERGGRLIAVAVVVVSMLGAWSARADADPIYWGAHVFGSSYGLPEPPLDMRAVDTFESHAGKRLSVLGVGHTWLQNGVLRDFPVQKVDNVRRHGSIPLLSWGSKEATGGPVEPALRNSVITSGRYDAFIRRFATAAKNWGHPLFLRFDWEMNGWWYPWGEGRGPDGAIVNGNRPGDFAAMWRHVRGIFDSVGATNVTWVWCVNHMTTSAQYPASLASMYPGAAYVDWTGIDAYNRYSGQWLSFAQMLDGSGTNWLRNTYQETLGLARGKPMMLAEYASNDDVTNPARKAQWIRDAFNVQLPTRFLAIKAVMWFNRGDSRPAGRTAMESSAASQAAFADSIGSDYFTSNSYGAMPATKIVAPRPNVRLIPVAVADTYSDAASPNTAFGRTASLVVDGSPVRRTFLTFDLTPLRGRVLTSARLQVTTTAAPASASSGRQSIKRVDQTNWSERFLTHNNTVAPSSTVLGAFSGLRANTTVSTRLNLLEVQRRVGARLSIAIDSSNADELIIQSREGASPPRLIVTYTAP